MCLLQLMEPVGGIVNNLDCPLYVLSTSFELVSNTSIAAEVSFVHECDDQCKFVSDSRPLLVERESVSVDELRFVHDYNSNNL